MTNLSSETRHASSIVIDGKAILISGPSGSGKSDLALRLIDRGAQLVSDDYTLIQRRVNGLWATAAPNIEGKIEVRGLGILDMPFTNEAEIKLIVVLSTMTERYPLTDAQETVLGIAVPVITLSPFEASAVIKAELALKMIEAR
jgi:serine kinase of HPr protein (carbohydrate metabolism regulator)